MSQDPNNPVPPELLKPDPKPDNVVSITKAKRKPLTPAQEVRRQELSRSSHKELMSLVMRLETYAGEVSEYLNSVKPVLDMALGMHSTTLVVGSMASNYAQHAQLEVAVDYDTDKGFAAAHRASELLHHIDTKRGTELKAALLGSINELVNAVVYLGEYAQLREEVQEAGTFSGTDTPGGRQ